MLLGIYRIVSLFDIHRNSNDVHMSDDTDCAVPSLRTTVLLLVVDKIVRRSPKVVLVACINTIGTRYNNIAQNETSARRMRKEKEQSDVIILNPTKNIGNDNVVVKIENRAESKVLSRAFSSDPNQSRPSETKTKRMNGRWLCIVYALIVQ